MSYLPFSRNLGGRPGVQLNPLRDDTDYPTLSTADQVFAVAGRFTRGRIDRSFQVTQSNQARALGVGGSLNASVLNEARVQIYEALRDGASAAVVARFAPSSSVLSLIAIKDAPLEADVFTVDTATPVGSLITLKHLECFSDGVIVEINAVEALDAGDEQVASKIVKLRLRDPVSKELLFTEFQGSLDPLAKDEYNKSQYLPDIVSAITDLLEVSVPPGALVAPTSSFYGLDANGADKFVSKLLAYYVEGQPPYAAVDYDAACKKLKRSQTGYGFIISGGNQDPLFITKLIELGYQVNKQVRWDISGTLTPEAVKNLYDSVGGTDSLYSQCFWAPLLADDPLNGGKAFIGTAGINVGLACARNARTDANGIARKNWPVAGSEFPLTRSGISQKFDPEDEELVLLAKTGINPVIFIDFASGGRYVFNDSITGAKTNADRKLIAVSDMATSVDDMVARYGQECLQKPMDTAIKMMTDFLQNLFEDLETAKWLIPSVELGNRAFVAEIKRNTSAPNSKMDVRYWTKYDGTNRVTEITQTLSK